MMYAKFKPLISAHEEFGYQFFMALLPQGTFFRIPSPISNHPRWFLQVWPTWRSGRKPKMNAGMRRSPTKSLDFWFLEEGTSLPPQKKKNSGVWGFGGAKVFFPGNPLEMGKQGRWNSWNMGNQLEMMEFQKLYKTMRLQDGAMMREIVLLFGSFWFFLGMRRKTKEAQHGYACDLQIMGSSCQLLRHESRCAQTWCQYVPSTSTTPKPKVQFHPKTVWCLEKFPSFIIVSCNFPEFTHPETNFQEAIQKGN